MKDLIDHHILKELSESVKWHSHFTKIVYQGYLERWIRPSWGRFSIGTHGCSRGMAPAFEPLGWQTTGEFHKSKDTEPDECVV